MAPKNKPYSEDNKPRGVNIKGLVGSIELTENIFEHLLIQL